MRHHASVPPQVMPLSRTNMLVHQLTGHSYALSLGALGSFFRLPFLGLMEKLRFVPWLQLGVLHVRVVCVLPDTHRPIAWCTDSWPTLHGCGVGGHATTW